MKEIFLTHMTSKLGSKIPLPEEYIRQNKVKFTSRANDRIKNKVIKCF